jgi:ABC-type multidrug transport system ATPase subunit
MGYLPQKRASSRMSVIDNLIAVLRDDALRGPNDTRKRSGSWRSSSSRTWPDTSPTRCREASGGVSNSRALATRPRILLLDEPFAGVDPINVQEIQDLVRRMRDKGLGILITDHNVRETLRLTDRASIIHEGKILRTGSALELIHDEQVRRIYLGHSFDAPVAGVSAAEERELFDEPRGGAFEKTAKLGPRSPGTSQRGDGSGTRIGQVLRTHLARSGRAGTFSAPKPA